MERLLACLPKRNKDSATESFLKECPDYMLFASLYGEFVSIVISIKLGFGNMCLLAAVEFLAVLPPKEAGCDDVAIIKVNTGF